MLLCGAFLSILCVALPLLCLLYYAFSIVELEKKNLFASLKGDCVMNYNEVVPSDFETCTQMDYGDLTNIFMWLVVAGYVLLKNLKR